MPKYARLKGTQDILPVEQPYWEHLRMRVAEIARAYGFERIDTPIFELTELFNRGVGDATDIVEKEMYAFKDRGGNEIALRPEFTAGVMRAYIENGMQVLPKPVKLYSIGPIFRHEQPQAGRYRQFHQFNAEILGVQDPLADLEIMLLAWDIYDSLGFQSLAFQVHSTGCPICRPQYVSLLAEHYRAHADAICDDCKRRVAVNPLRVLDCKQPQCQPIIAGAPKMLEHLCGECAAHFTKLRGYLEHLGKPHTINPRLVRGLDYYTKTVFEVWAEGIGAQAAVCGGGRYDGLIELLGGHPTPGVGFAAGMERAVMVMQAQHIAVPPLPAPLVFIAFLGDATARHAAQLLRALRQAGLGAQIAMGGSLRSQLRQADKSAARFTLIVGEDEIAQDVVTLRDMATGEQETAPLNGVAQTIVERLG
ncbi:MAG TPA: histidine--tRNA ligase [Anaerolineae bacterium]|nr:histidine--tRNA ligase [Anaerolineae bacterium]